MSTTEQARILNSQFFPLYATPLTLPAQSALGAASATSHFVNTKTTSGRVDLAGRRSLAGLSVLTTLDDNADLSIGVWGVWEMKPSRTFKMDSRADAEGLRQSIWASRLMGTVTATAGGTTLAATEGYSWANGGEVMRWCDTLSWTPSDYFAQMASVYGTTVSIFDATSGTPTAGVVADMAINDLGDMQALVFEAYDTDEPDPVGKAQILVSLGY